MKRHSRATRISFALAVVVLAVGVGVSAISGDWDWLARAGSLIVVVGILLTSTQIIDNARRARQHDRDWHATRSARRDWAQEGVQLRASRDRDDDLQENERSGLYLLVAGTLIWGFGDLVGLLV